MLVSAFDPEPASSSASSFALSDRESDSVFSETFRTSSYSSSEVGTTLTPIPSLSCSSLKSHPSGTQVNEVAEHTSPPGSITLATKDPTDQRDMIDPVLTSGEFGLFRSLSDSK